MNSINLLPISKTDLPFFNNNSLSVKQNEAHYTGHYMKYIQNYIDFISKTQNEFKYLYTTKEYNTLKCSSQTIDGSFIVISDNLL